MRKSAIVLAGGFSKRLGEDKGMIKLAGKSLINHVLDAASEIVDEQIVVVSSQDQARRYSRILASGIKVLVDNQKLHGPLVGALTGLKAAHGQYTLILACDTPFVSKDIMLLLFDLSMNKSAVIPRWPNCYIEPLQAVYCTRPATEAARDALNQGETDMQTMIDRLRGVRYISTLVLQQLDPELRTFFNINTPLDLKKAEAMMKLHNLR